MWKVKLQGCLFLLLHVFITKASSQNVAMFVFGDSVFDCGNNNFLDVDIEGKANFVPYGESFFPRPTGRFSDGRTVPDYAATFMNLPLWIPYLDPNNNNFTIGATFASAGAQVLNDSTAGTLNLNTQLSYFKDAVSLLKQQLGEEAAEKIISNAIYFSSLGGVDYMAFGSSYPDATDSEKKEYVNRVVDKIVNVTEEIYELGGRKFAFQNVGSLGCDPDQKQTYNITSTDECVEIFQSLASMHNEALSNATEELQSELTGFTYLIFDFFNALMDRSKYPIKYGFKVGDVACCGSGTHRASGCGRTTTYELCSNPNEYVFFDGGHNTDACNVQLAELLWNGTTDVTWPMNLRQLCELNITSEVNYLVADE